MNYVKFDSKSRYIFTHLFYDRCVIKQMRENGDNNGIIMQNKQER